MGVPQLTVRGLDDELETRLRQHAARYHLSLSQAAVDLMRRGAGLAPATATEPTIGHSLDAWLGGWTVEQARAMAEAVRAFDAPDPDLWR